MSIFVTSDDVYFNSLSSSEQSKHNSLSQDNFIHFQLNKWANCVFKMYKREINLMLSWS